MKYSRLEKLAYDRGYRVSDEGIVSSTKNENIGGIINGYHFITIRVDGNCRNIRSHRLLAYQKYGDKIYEPGTVVRHLDGDSNNNHINNIAIGTYSENMMDIPKEVRIAKAKHATSFVKKHDHSEILKFYHKVKSYKMTMEKFGISSKGTLYFIIKKSIDR